MTKIGIFISTLSGFLLMSAIILMTTCTSENTPPEIIKVGYSPLIINLPVFVAHENGYFEDNGLNISFEKMSSTNTMRDAVSVGEIHFAAALGTDMFFKNNNLSPGNLFSLYFNTLTVSNYTDAIITKSDSEFNSLLELDGKKVGVYPASTVEMFLDLIAKDANISVIPIRVNPTESLQLLDTGEFDALFILEPLLTIALRTDKYKVVEVAPIAKRLRNEIPVGTYVVNGRLHEKFPDIAGSFQVAMDSAVTFIDSNREEAIKLGEKFLEASIDQYIGVNLPAWKSGCSQTLKPSLDYLKAILLTEELISVDTDQSEYIICSN